MEWLLYMVVSALLLEGLIFFIKGHSFHNRVVEGLAEEVEADEVIAFITLIFGYLCVVACMPLIIFVL